MLGKVGPEAVKLSLVVACEDLQAGVALYGGEISAVSASKEAGRATVQPFGGYAGTVLPWTRSLGGGAGLTMLKHVA